jgi:hypothetical protein
MRFAFTVLTVLLALPLTVRAQQPAVQPDVHVGDRWTFQQRDGLTDDLQAEFTRRVVTVSPAEITVVTQVKGRAGQTVNYFTRDWNLIDNGTTKYDPPIMTLHLPMKPGDTWQGPAKSRALSNGFTMNCHLSAKVATRETVKVLAGSFETLRVDSRLECRGADANAAAVQVAASNWYSPAVKAIVKTVSSSTFEGRERSRAVTEMLTYSLADRADPGPSEVPLSQVPPGQAPAPAQAPLKQTPSGHSANPSMASPVSPDKGI